MDDLMSIALMRFVLKLIFFSLLWGLVFNKVFYIAITLISALSWKKCPHQTQLVWLCSQHCMPWLKCSNLRSLAQQHAPLPLLLLWCICQQITKTSRKMHTATLFRRLFLSNQQQQSPIDQAKSHWLIMYCII